MTSHRSRCTCWSTIFKDLLDKIPGGTPVLKRFLEEIAAPSRHFDARAGRS